MSSDPKANQIEHLLNEIYELRITLADVSRRLARIDRVVKSAFPNAVAPREAAAKRDRAHVGELPTMDRDQALKFFDDLREVTADGGAEAAMRKLDDLSIANLGLLARELGATIGKKKPSRRVLANEIMGKVRQSIMLREHTPVSMGN